MPQNTVVKIMHKRISLRIYKAQIAQSLKSNDLPQQPAFTAEILDRIDTANDYLQRVALSDEAALHTSGQVNRHNVRVQGS